MMTSTSLAVIARMSDNGSDEVTVMRLPATAAFELNAEEVDTSTLDVVVGGVGA
jgi:hypothetical protein